MRFKRKLVHRASMISGIMLASALLAAAGTAAANAAPVEVATTHSTAAPTSNVHLGQILAQLPHSGNKCSEKAQAAPVHVSVTGTAARPDAYVNVTTNAKCQLVVSKIAYGVGASTTTGSAAT